MEYEGPRQKRPKASFVLMVTSHIDFYCEFTLNLVTTLIYCEVMLLSALTNQVLNKI